jgi:hypothetical protein
MYTTICLRVRTALR